MTDIAALLRQSGGQLRRQLALSSDTARLEARLLLQQVLPAANTSWLMLHAHTPIAAEAANQFTALLQRRLSGTPMAYLLGHREFYSLDFHITPDVLIPRPDTETLIEAALAQMPPQAPCRVLDLGTGSGILALTLAHHRPQAQGIASDISVAALEVARQNARKLGITTIKFVQSDWFSAIPPTSFEVIVSNPPYIAEHDPHLQQGDVRYEPTLALVSGPDGLDAIRQIIATAPDYLTPDGILLLEHGYDQVVPVQQLFRQAGWLAVTTHRDLSGVERVTQGRMPLS